MKKTAHSYLITAFAFALLLGNSCANPGAGPGGGLKDTLAPNIIAMHPEMFQTNYNGKEITISFDEYVVPDNLSSKLVVSPPLAKKPTIKTKGKSIIVKIEEDLIPSRTYSIDFKDGIKDYNEGNKVESIRMLFSTYDNIDTLRISGYLLDALTLNPVENATATLYTIDEDSVFSTMRPDFIAKVDKEGYFLFDNLPEGKYKLYGLVDIDNNLHFTQDLEQIAFIDSFIVPTATYIHKIDTLINKGDTIISYGYTEFLPEPLFGFLFTQEKYLQYMTSSKRENTDKMLLTFNESLSDSFNFQLISQEYIENWNYTEYSRKRDSLSIWITDTTLINNDSLYLRVAYTIADSLLNPVTQIDTLKMFYSPKAAKTKTKKKENDNKPKSPSFSFSTNITSNNFDIHIPIILESPSPLEFFPDSLFKLKLMVNDSTYEKVNFKLDTLENNRRMFKLNYQPAEASMYVMSIDSGTIKTMSGITNLKFESKFKTQKKDFYGTAIIDISGVDQPSILQLLKNSKDENIVTEFKLQPNQKTISFNYLKPGKYKLKLIIDSNENNKWDTGSLENKLQPETVFYFDKILNIKSNWELKESWEINPKEFKMKKTEDPNSKNLDE